MLSRRAIAIRWMTALVEPPSAMTTLTAFSNERMVDEVLRPHGPPRPSRRCAGRNSDAMREWLESGAGIEAAPGSVMPSASAALVMVEAVPIVMQWPGERAIDSSMSCHCALGDVAGALLVPVLPVVAAAAEDLAAPVGVEHRTGRHEDAGQAHAERAHQQPGRGLVAAAHQHRAVDRVRAQHLLRLHRQEVAIEHRRRLHHRLAERDRRHLDREAAGLPDAALDLLDALLEVRMALVEVAPGVDDGDDRLVLEVGLRVADLEGARAMIEGPHRRRVVPALAAQVRDAILASCRRALRSACAGTSESRPAERGYRLSCGLVKEFVR